MSFFFTPTKIIKISEKKKLKKKMDPNSILATNPKNNHSMEEEAAFFTHSHTEIHLDRDSALEQNFDEFDNSSSESQENDPSTHPEAKLDPIPIENGRQLFKAHPNQPLKPSAAVKSEKLRTAYMIKKITTKMTKDIL
jgi:hypothetical protein